MRSHSYHGKLRGSCYNNYAPRRYNFALIISLVIFAKYSLRFHTNARPNQPTANYLRKTDERLPLRKTIFFHSFPYLRHSFPNSCNFPIVPYCFRLKKKEPKKIYLKLFFFFYLEEFYNQFSLRIINKLFWRGTITWTIRVETHVKYLKLVPIKIRTSMMKFHLQFDHQPPCTVC